MWTERHNYAKCPWKHLAFSESPVSHSFPQVSPSLSASPEATETKSFLICFEHYSEVSLTELLSDRVSLPQAPPSADHHSFLHLTFPTGQSLVKSLRLWPEVVMKNMVLGISVRGGKGIPQEQICGLAPAVGFKSKAGCRIFRGSLSIGLSIGELSAPGHWLALRDPREGSRRNQKSDTESLRGLGSAVWSQIKNHGSRRTSIILVPTGKRRFTQELDNSVVTIQLSFPWNELKAYKQT